MSSLFSTADEVMYQMSPEDLRKLIPTGSHERKFVTLYRLFNSAGELLYVGISQHVFQRLEQHAIGRKWSKDVARVEMTHYDDRAKARSAETAAIQSEKPRYNITDNSLGFVWDGDRLQRARQAAGMTQGALADELFVSVSTIAKYEQNNARPAIDKLVLMAQALSVSADYLLGIDEGER